MTNFLWVWLAMQPLLGFSAFRDPDAQQALRWANNTVELTLNSAGSDDVSDGQDLAAMRAAIATWQAALGQGLSLSEGASSSSRSYGNDGVNRVTFLEDGWLSGADTALGTTLPNIVDGAFVDVDIVLNGTDGPWTVDGDPHGIDIRSVVTHELGHLIGLWHAASSQTVMYTGARGGTTFRRALQADDLAGVAYLTGASSSCVDDADCPLLVATFGGTDMRLTCQAQHCQPGQVGYGGDCTDGGQCQSGLCLRDPWTGNSRDPGFCTQACDASACPHDDLCIVVAEQRFCVPGRDCLSDADCGGGANVHCMFDFDGRYSCQQTCLQDEHCLPGQRCIDLGYGAGICATPGALANGAPCLSPMSCQGLACRGDSQNLSCATASPMQDGGVTPDVPRYDASSQADAGLHVDAGAQDLAPVEASVPDTADIPLGPAPEPGCGCAQSSVNLMPAPSLILLIGLLMGARWRRKRSFF